MTTSPQLNIKQANIAFKRQSGEVVRGLSDINFKINSGEVIGVIGTNGAGKSTLFNCLTGRIPLDSGDIILDNQSISRMNRQKIAQEIGIVFQDPRMGTAPRMSVFENLMLANNRGATRGLRRSLNQKNRQQLIKRLQPFKLDLENRLDIPIENLSGGQRQAVSLVMATLQKPKLLLLDEHTASLDPRTAKLVMQMTQILIEENQLTTLMITHNMQDALNYCEKIIVMHKGKFVKVFTQDEIPKLTTSDLYQTLEKLVEVEANDVELAL